MRIQFYRAAKQNSLLETVKEAALVGASAQAHADLDPAWLVNFGAVYCNGKRVRDPSFTVRPESVLRVHWRPKRFQSDRPPKVVGQTEDFLIVDKPSGLPTHPTLDNYIENCWFTLTQSSSSPLHPVHRLDVETSGLLVFAKSVAAQNRFQLWHTLTPDSNHLMRKIYRVLVERQSWLFPDFIERVCGADSETTASHALSLERFSPKTGVYTHYMVDSKRSPKTLVDRPQADAKICRLAIHRVEPQTPRRYLLEIELHTGRTHQIRAQMARIGFPVVGDMMYGLPAMLGHETYRFGLRSYRLEFNGRVWQAPTEPMFEFLEKAPK